VNWNPNQIGNTAQGRHGLVATGCIGVYVYAGHPILQALHMSHPQHEMVDLLEIFHARSTRDHVLRELKRLRSDDHCLPGQDPLRRREIRDYYERMLLTSVDLLDVLGDRIRD